MITKPEVELRRLSFITVGEVPLWWGRGPSLLHRRLRSGAADYADTDSHHSDGGYNSNHPSRDPAGHDRLHPRMRFTPDYDCASPMLVIVVTRHERIAEVRPRPKAHCRRTALNLGHNYYTLANSLRCR
jgi:hypothetical protein